MKKIKIRFQRKEMKIEKHPGMKLPFCPLCGKELFCLVDRKGKILSFATDLILFCKDCKIFWYNDRTYFGLKKIYDLNDWELEIKEV
jgi:hypothetical protein